MARGNVSVTGDLQTEKNLRMIAKEISKKIAIINMKAASPMLHAARSNAATATDRRTGLLPKSIKAKKAKRRGKHRSLVVVGPTHMKRMMRLTKTGKLRGVSKKKVGQLLSEGVQLITVNPGRYGMWIEWGTEHARARPFLRPAYQANIQRWRDIIRKSEREELIAAARKVYGTLHQMKK